MAEGRMLRRKIAHDKRLARLSNDRTRLFFTWCIPFLDVEGRMTGDAEVIKAMVFPFVKTISLRTIEQDIVECDRIRLVHAYAVDGQRYLYFPGFHKNQQLRRDREAKSEIPAPPEPPVGDVEDKPCGSTPGVGDHVGGSTPGTLRDDSGSTPAEVKLSEEKRSAREHSRKTPLPDDFTLTDARRVYAAKKGITPDAVDDLFEHFREWHTQNGSKWSDWDATWRTWVLREIKMHPPVPGPGDGGWDAGRQVWECGNTGCPDGGVHESPNKASIPAGRGCPQAERVANG